ncbi:MAG: hypothetical protein JWO90_1305 [Solirubrobacterales bacterium]|nr:hypothetical protein [Solirubrobacterales bacterium]
MKASPRHLAPLPVLAALALLPAISPSAAAATAELPGVDIAIPDAVKRQCQQGLLTGAAGTRVTPYVVTQDGAVRGRLTGAQGDWDLAAFDAGTGKRLGASATMGAKELVTVLARQGDTIAFQACRRTGASTAAGLAIDLAPADVTPDPTTLPPRLVEIAVTDSKDAATLEGLGFDTTHNTTDRTVEAILRTREEGERLARLGYDFTVTEPDLPALAREVAAQDRTTAARSAARALPSQRTTYRTYADYGTDLKALVETYPGHVKAVNLGTSLDGQPIEGVEIATNVGRPGDGRPIFVLGGLTHAREWPSGDTAMEFAIDAARSLADGTDARMNAMLARTRVVVLPVQNPDGFAVSRQAGAAMASGDDANELVTLPLAATDSGAYKRKNCRAADAAAMLLPCALRGPNGVDLNRAYSAYWGGPGSSSDSITQQYRGPAPFTEPEAQALRRFGAAHQVQVYITQHTYTDGRWLRQPGFDAADDEVPPTVQDEAAIKELGDAMADATGYVSELGYATLGNITGPADDFLYYSQGTYGYTPELRGTNFHTNFADAVVAEYEGVGAKAGRGLREAYIIAGERAANAADHVVVTGTAPAGRVLRLKKTTDLKSYATTGQTPTIYPETLDTVLTVPASGSYEWHVNPSTRPLLPARSEAFTFTCETPEGTVLETQTLVADRGERLTRNFTCDAPSSATSEATATPKSAEPTTVTTGVEPRASSAAPVRVEILRPAFSARRTKRVGGVNLYLRLTGGLQNVTATIRDSRGKLLLSGRAATLPRSGRVALTRRAILRPGRLVVRVTGTDALGRRVTATRSSRLVR